MINVSLKILCNEFLEVTTVIEEQCFIFNLPYKNKLFREIGTIADTYETSCVPARYIPGTKSA